MRAMIGRSNQSEPRNTSDSASVVATGWRKYMNVPLSSPTIVRMVRPVTASCSTPGIRCPLTSRRSTDPYDHASAASIAAAGPTVTRNT